VAHEIVNNMMFSVRKTPWHRQGVVLENAPNSREAIVAAKLDWMVWKQRNYIYNTQLPVGGELFATDSFTTVRWEETNGFNGTPKYLPITLGTVTNDYEIVQNIDAFNMLDQYFIDRGFTYETAGAIQNGRKVWMMLKSPNRVFMEQEAFDDYFLLTTGHDGKKGVNVLPTTIRVVCNNTLTFALQSKNQIQLIHKGGVNQSLGFMLDNIASIGFSETKEAYEKMMNYNIDPLQAIKFFEMVEPRLQERNDPEIKRNVWKQMFNGLNECFFYGEGNCSERKTLWQAYNAVTEYVDYYKKLGNADSIEYSQFGSGAQLKQFAYNTATKVMTGERSLIGV
jgi:phage/plasmid-like protein (TIGR03299 family)